jgi:hypothetical protein
VQRELAHVAATELIVRSRAALAELQPEQRTGAARIPERSAQEWRQATLDFLSQGSSVVRHAMCVQVMCRSLPNRINASLRATACDAVFSHEVL